MKKCSKCLQEKELYDFPKDKSRPDGKYIYCKSCVSNKSKERYYFDLDHSRELKREQAKKHRERNIANSKEWYEANKEKVKERVKKYRTKNKEWYKDYQKKWVKENPDKVLDKQRRWTKTEKGKQIISQRNHNRKALIRGAKGKHSSKEWIAMKKKHDYTCLHCGKREPEIKLTRDHVVPISKGGNNDILNIQPLCKSCNSKKHDKIQ